MLILHMTFLGINKIVCDLLIHVIHLVSNKLIMYYFYKIYFLEYVAG
jgi:hypothetical protein